MILGLSVSFIGAEGERSSVLLQLRNGPAPFDFFTNQETLSASSLSPEP